MAICMKLNARLSGFVLGLAMSTGVTFAAGNSAVGVWVDHTGRGAVEIVECDGGKLCGRLVWLKDEKNSQACGTKIIGDAGPVQKGSWDNGWIYSPEKDEKYDVELTPNEDGTLTVLGYLGTKLFSEEMTWTKAPADIKRCDVQDAKATKPVEASSPSEQKTAAVAAPVQTAKEAELLAAAKTSDPAKRAEGPAVVPTEPTAKPPEPKSEQIAQIQDSPKKAAEVRRPKTEKRAAKRSKTRMCRVDAPFVRVDFPCDDD